MNHIINDDCCTHLHCLQCWCNPVEVAVEGETYIIHNNNYDSYGQGTTEIQLFMQENRDSKKDIRK